MADLERLIDDQLGLVEREAHSQLKKLLGESEASLEPMRHCSRSRMGMDTCYVNVKAWRKGGSSLLGVDIAQPSATSRDEILVKRDSAIVLMDIHAVVSHVPCAANSHLIFVLGWCMSCSRRVSTILVELDDKSSRQNDLLTSLADRCDGWCTWSGHKACVIETKHSIYWNLIRAIHCAFCRAFICSSVLPLGVAVFLPHGY
ncbi:hypothetical protein HPP92_006748 [Vanilla planifolia]|uniref:Uncharacterized protein n=1 Tax=Vanilla planifolia TaxID=51239 RepID=A0A835RKG9_VANPL|nr:hypothetical protein HPP92_006748 [Vanilla planifolia]